SGFDFYILAVNASGVSLANDYPSVFESYSSRIHFDGGTGLVYSDAGRAVDPSTGEPAGLYSIDGPGVMTPDSTLNRAFFVDFFGDVDSFNLQQFSFVKSIAIPDFSGLALRIVRFGNNGLAFNTYQGPVYLIGGNFVH